MRNLQGTKYAVRKAAKADPFQKEVAAAKILEENGHEVFFIPENNIPKGTKNPDAIIDGLLGDFKILTSKSAGKIIDRILECDNQKATIACIQPPTEYYSREEAIEKARDALKEPLRFVRMIYLIWNNEVIEVKK
jgi:hypothetical protein